MTIIPEKSHVSSTKEKVSGSTPHHNKGKKKVNESIFDTSRNNRVVPREEHD